MQEKFLVPFRRKLYKKILTWSAPLSVPGSLRTMQMQHRWDVSSRREGLGQRLPLPSPVRTALQALQARRVSSLYLETRRGDTGPLRSRLQGRGKHTKTSRKGPAPSLGFATLVVQKGGAGAGGSRNKPHLRKRAAPHTGRRSGSGASSKRSAKRRSFPSPSELADGGGAVGVARSNPRSSP